MYCKNCGKPVNDGSKFCKNCGVNLVPSTMQSESAIAGQPTQRTSAPPPTYGNTVNLETTNVPAKSSGNKKVKGYMIGAGIIGGVLITIFFGLNFFKVDNGKMSPADRKKLSEALARYDGFEKVWSEGLLCVTKDGKSGFIDKSGKEVIPLIDDWSGDKFSLANSILKSQRQYSKFLQ